MLTKCAREFQVKPPSQHSAVPDKEQYNMNDII